MSEELAEAVAEVASKAVETPAKDEGTTESRIQDYIDNLHKPEEAAEAEPAAPVEEVAPEVPAEEPAKQPEAAEPAGPTTAMKAVAKQQDVPDYLIKLAKTDEELEEVIAERAAEQRAAAKHEPEPEFALSLPEEEYPADDPVRKQFSQLHEHYQQKLKVHEQALVTLIQEMRESRTETDAQKEHAERQWVSQFDSGLDELQSEALGQASQRTDELNEIRTAVFNTAKRMQGERPELSAKELAQQAAIRLGLAKTPAKQAHENAVREMNGKTRTQQPAKFVTKPMSAKEKIQARLNGNLDMKPSRPLYSDDLHKNGV